MAEPLQITRDTNQNIMANPHIVTVSNRPQLDTDRLDELGELLDEFDFFQGGVPSPGEWAGVRDGDLSLYGNGEFVPVHKDSYDNPGEHLECDDTDEFATRIAEFLESELTIRTISHTKFRWPAHARQITIHPDGTVVEDVLGGDTTVRATGE